MRRIILSALTVVFATTMVTAAHATTGDLASSSPASTASDSYCLLISLRTQREEQIDAVGHC